MSARAPVALLFDEISAMFEISREMTEPEMTAEAPP